MAVVSELRHSGREHGVDGVPATSGEVTTTLTELLRMRAAYQSCMRVGVEADYCEYKIMLLDEEIRACIANGTTRV